MGSARRRAADVGIDGRSEPAGLMASTRENSGAIFWFQGPRMKNFYPGKNRPVVVARAHAGCVCR